MELKHLTRIPHLTVVQAFNQTKMELKLLSPPYMSLSYWTFNQTKMELKQRNGRKNGQGSKAFNQTKMELKRA